MREIALTQGKIAIVDDEDHEGLVCFPWVASLKRDRYYAQRTVGPRRDRHTIAMHRVIVGAIPGELVDHRDGNTLDNRRLNLRKCTPTQNQWNRHRIWSKSGLKGVHRVDRGCNLKRPWAAEICINGKNVHLGYFAFPEEAAIAYNRAAMIYFGEFANINRGLEPLAFQAIS